jgi:hypothetical protein
LRWSVVALSVLFLCYLGRTGWRRPKAPAAAIEATPEVAEELPPLAVMPARMPADRTFHGVILYEQDLAGHAGRIVEIEGYEARLPEITSIMVEGETWCRYVKCRRQWVLKGVEKPSDGERRFVRAKGRLLVEREDTNVFAYSLEDFEIVGYSIASFEERDRILAQNPPVTPQSEMKGCEGIPAVH